MQLKQLFDDDSAVSPVIGVILMVAITVILAAVIATFVLGLGESVSDTAPNANFQADQLETEFDDDQTDVQIVEFTHTSGPAIDRDELDVTTPSGADIDIVDEVDGDNQAEIEITESSGATDEVSASDSLFVEVVEVQLEDGGGDQTLFEEGDRFSVVWNSGGDSATLRTFELEDDITVTEAS